MHLTPNLAGDFPHNAAHRSKKRREPARTSAKRRQLPLPRSQVSLIEAKSSLLNDQLTQRLAFTAPLDSGYATTATMETIMVMERRILLGSIRDPQAQVSAIVLNGLEEALLRSTMVQRDTFIAGLLGRRALAGVDLTTQRNRWAISSATSMYTEFCGIITCRAMFIAVGWPGETKSKLARKEDATHLLPYSFDHTAMSSTWATLPNRPTWPARRFSSHLRAWSSCLRASSMLLPSTWRLGTESTWTTSFGFGTKTQIVLSVLLSVSRPCTTAMQSHRKCAQLTFPNRRDSERSSRCSA